MRYTEAATEARKQKWDRGGQAHAVPVNVLNNRGQTRKQTPWDSRCAATKPVTNQHAQQSAITGGRGLWIAAR